MDMDLYRGRDLLSLVQVQEGPVVWVVLKQIEGKLVLKLYQLMMHLPLL